MNNLITKIKSVLEIVVGFLLKSAPEGILLECGEYRLCSIHQYCNGAIDGD
jgi:hypothetical protein